MGYNTTVLLLNDASGDIERHPKELVDGILEHMHRGYLGGKNYIGVGQHANAAKVVAISHADEVNVIAVGGNYATILGRVHRGNQGHHEAEDKLSILSEIVDRMGYKLVKKGPVDEDVYRSCLVKLRQDLRQLIAECGIPSNPGWSEDDIISSLRKVLKK